MSAPDDCSPRLMWWDSLWRYVLVLAVSGLAWGEIAHREWTHGSPWFWVDLAGGLVSLWLVRYRRRWPFGIALTLTLFGLFSMSAAGPGVLAAVSLFTRRRWRQIIPIGLLNVVVGQLYTSYQPTGNSDPAWLSLAFNTVATVAVVFAMTAAPEPEPSRAAARREPPSPRSSTSHPGSGKATEGTAARTVVRARCTS